MTLAVPIIVGLVVQRVLEWFRTAPGITKIIFRAGAEGRGELLTIHKELFIAFTPPPPARIPDMEHHANEPPGSLSLDYRPINVALRFIGQENVAMPLGMETTKTLERLRERSMNNFKACHTRLLAFVD